MVALEKVDHGAMSANQVLIIALSILAFVLDQAWIAAGVAAVMTLGTLIGKPGFYPLYRYVLKPLGIARPRVLLDNPEPHRFAQGLGAAFMIAGSGLLFGGAGAAGWVLVWLVATLAALNAFGGFCVGCFAYYWLGRFGVPGFTKAPPAGTFPGMRPGAIAAGGIGSGENPAGEAPTDGI